MLFLQCYLDILPSESCCLCPFPSNLSGLLCLPPPIQRDRTDTVIFKIKSWKFHALLPLLFRGTPSWNLDTIPWESTNYPSWRDHMERPYVGFLANSPTVILANSQHQPQTMWLQTSPDNSGPQLWSQPQSSSLHSWVPRYCEESSFLWPVQISDPQKHERW